MQTLSATEMVIKRQGKYTQITVVRNTMAFRAIDE
jgi:ribosomal protein L10